MVGNQAEGRVASKGSGVGEESEPIKSNTRSVAEAASARHLAYACKVAAQPSLCSGDDVVVV